MNSCTLKQGDLAAILRIVQLTFINCEGILKLCWSFCCSLQLTYFLFQLWNRKWKWTVLKFKLCFQQWLLKNLQRNEEDLLALHQEKVHFVILLRNYTHSECITQIDLQYNGWAVHIDQYETIIGQGWAKYCDTRDTDKSLSSHVITEFNNCFIIRAPSLFSYLNHSLTAQGSNLPFFTQEHGFNYTWATYM